MRVFSSRHRSAGWACGYCGVAFRKISAISTSACRDPLYVRGDVTVPLTPSLALVGGAGYENVEISSRDALRDANGVPIIGDDGRFVTDPASARILAFDVDGLLWDVGVLWRPSSRTSLEARVGERYDSTTYYGTFTYVPNQRSAFAVAVYDGVTGFGGLLNNSLAGLSSDFEAIRNPVTGDFRRFW